MEHFSYKQKFLKKYPLGFILLCIYLISFPFFARLNLISLMGRVGISDLILLSSLIFTIPLIFFTKVKFNLNAFIILIVYLTIVLFTALNTVIFSDNKTEFLLQSFRLFQVILLLILLNKWMYVEIYREKIVKFFLMGAIIASLIGILQMLDMRFIWDITDKYYVDSIEKAFSSYTYYNRVAAVSFFPTNGNYFGSYMAISLLVLWNYKHYYKVWKIFLFSFLYLIGLFSSLSWTSTSSLLIGFAFSILFLCFIKKKINRKYFYGFLAIVVLFCLISIVNWSNFYDKFFRYFLSRGFGFIPGLEARLNLWEEGISKINNLKAFFFGVGYSGYKLMDNFYLEILIAGGFIPLLAFVSMIIFLALKTNIVLKLVALIMFTFLNLMASYGGYAALLTGFILIFFDGELKKKNEKYCLNYE